MDLFGPDYLTFDNQPDFSVRPDFYINPLLCALGLGQYVVAFKPGKKVI
jgi:hypothetical protein